MNTPVDDVGDLIEFVASFSSDPYGFVLAAYPWGEVGGPLQDFTGPEPWQVDILNDMGNGVISVVEAIAAAGDHDIETMPIRIARTSGHGIGKSALVAWIIDWAQSTLEDTKGVVTANTENQLKTKTWAELAKWHRMSITKSMFRMTATARFSMDPDHASTWRIDMVPWSEKNMEAFAGLHNLHKRILLVFDEASAIADLIWETSEGAMTDKSTQIIWAVFGNPTKNTGRFRECFDGGKFEHRWNHAAVDSREVSLTNKQQIKEWIDDYGEDHDFVRVRVTGKFPRVDGISFISYESVKDAQARPVPEGNQAPVVLGVDVARFGDNKSVIYPRRGRDARTLQPKVFSSLSTIQLAAYTRDTFYELDAVAIFVDGGGVGGGVVDQLTAWGLPVYEVQFGGKSDHGDPGDQHTKYMNKRSEIWGSMRRFLETGCIPEDIPMLENSLSDELTAPTYTFSKEDTIQLESKKDLRRRNVASPDAADALACTFAYPSLIFRAPVGAASQYENANPHS